MNRYRRRCVTVLGGGTAGLTVAKLLSDSGWMVRVVSSGARQSRAIALPETTTAMVREIWGQPVSDIAPVHKLTLRRVAWSSPAFGSMEADALSVDAGDLAAGFKNCLDDVEFVADMPKSDPADGLIDARGPAPPEVCQFMGGARSMTIISGLPCDSQLSQQSETLAGDGFWMFFLPTCRDRMTVQIATPSGAPDPTRIFDALSHAPPDSLAAQLSQAHSWLSRTPPQQVTTAPRLGPPLNGTDAISAGDRAIAFDPVAGDGTGQGFRSACLSVAALNALSKGEDASAVLDYIRSRYAYAFTSHLTHCLRYYGSIQAPDAWFGEMQAMRNTLWRVGQKGGSASLAFRMRLSKLGRPTLVRG